MALSVVPQCDDFGLCPLIIHIGPISVAACHWRPSGIEIYIRLVLKDGHFVIRHGS
ncbi:MAG: hypothetical protein R3C02_00955 [Planctomycetaceae bacterium]